MSQMTLFDAAQPMNEPRFSIGDPIYKVCLDVVERYVISGIFSLGVDAFGDHAEPGQTLWRYHLDRVEGRGHNVFGEYEMGEMWFSDLGAAKARASLNRGAIEVARLVVRCSALRISEPVAFQEVREQDGYTLTRQAARIGDTVVFEKRTYSYPFLKVLKTKQKASRYYNALVKELETEGGTPVSFAPCDMYKVSDELWSSYEYAERHGNWSCLEHPQSVAEKYSRPAAKKERMRGHER